MKKVVPDFSGISQGTSPPAALSSRSKRGAAARVKKCGAKNAMDAKSAKERDSAGFTLRSLRPLRSLRRSSVVDGVLPQLTQVDPRFTSACVLETNPPRA